MRISDWSSDGALPISWLLVERIGEQIGNEQRPVQIIVHATSPCVSVSAREHSASAPLYCRVMKSRTPPKRRNAIQTKAKILAAAQQAFSETGYSQSGIRDIAATAYVSSTLLPSAIAALSAAEHPSELQSLMR